MVSDGVVDPTAWILYKVILHVVTADASSCLLHQVLHLPPADTEKTYSGLTDGCSKAGRTGCRLIEFTGGNASGDDVKVPLNYAHNVIDPFSQLVNQTDCLPYQLSNFIAMES